MTFTEYQELARRTQNAALTPQETMFHALFGLASEIGEIHSIFQHVYQGKPVSKNEVKDEMSDCFWFLSELADSLGLSLDEIARHNIDKLKARYPEGFSEERSMNRHQYEKEVYGGIEE